MAALFNFVTLFKTLYSWGMCPIYLRILIKIYEEQQMRIKWNNSVSDYFAISNGVKQGGVLSPVLSMPSIYIYIIEGIGTVQYMFR